jgi:peptidoglycan hydrolase CwlO-like protein
MMWLGIASLILSSVVVAGIAAATGIANERQRATQLIKQIESIDRQVERLGQKYDEAQLRLHSIRHQIDVTKATVATLK